MTNQRLNTAAARSSTNERFVDRFCARVRLQHTLVRAIATMALTVAVVFGLANPGSAQSAIEIADEIESSGSYLEQSSPGLEQSISDANGQAIAFAWLQRSGSESEATVLAGSLVDELRARNSNYDTALVLFEDSYGASSNRYDQQELDAGLDAALDGFADGDEAAGLTSFISSVQNSPTTATTIGSGSTNSSPQDSSNGGGFGFGTFLLLGVVAAGAFWLFRRWRASKQAADRQELDMEQDRAEIKEQLRDNADKIMSLGDRVIDKGDHGMIAKYEKASETYQEVSQSIDGASTPLEIDSLDDQIDHAEWQLESIEAELEGRPIPPMPVDDDTPPPPNASDRTKSSRQDDVAVSPRTGRSYPRSRPRSNRRSGGMGGGLGGILGSILVGAISNGGLGGMSRRTQRRRTGGGLGGLGGSIGTGRSGGGLGRGGVLRRGGSRSRSGGGRSIGSRSKSSGGRRF